MNEIIGNKKVYIFGLSTETERVLNEWNGRYNVIGLLDGFKTEGYQYGYPIVNIEDIIDEKNIVIIVVARPGSCKAIAKRIGALCKEHDVPLFDIRGNNLLEEKRIVYDFSAIDGYTKQDLMKEIDGADAISFDLFDTLAVRNILSFDGVVGLIDSRLKERGIHIPDFACKRIKAEKELSQGSAPRLTEIYSELLKSTGIDNIETGELATIEFTVDKNLILARREMVELVNELTKNGRPVYITSDCYYSKVQIVQILGQIGVEGVTDILVSCEYGTAKTGELFEELKSLAGTSNIVHVGDDITADIESATRHSIKAFKIYSSIELMDAVGGLGLISDEMSMSDKVRAGMFIANIFNSPFQFDGAKRIHVDEVSDVGYLFAAPMIMDFTRWFEEESCKIGINNKWLGARDGYLLKRLYEIMYPAVHTDYFYTSRISAIRAGVESVADVEYVDGMKFSGGCEECLKSRFGIDIAELGDRDIDESADGLMRYAPAILNKAEERRANNIIYIESLDIKDGDIAFFDFVAKGTSQMYVQRLVPNHIRGLYFLQLEPQLMKDKNLEIKPFYSEDERENSAIFENYYILETLLTAPHASVDEFDKDGKPIFAKETRTDRDIACFMKAQDGIVEYVKRYIAICPERTINKELDEKLLILLRNVEIRDKDFLSLIVEDPFFNRMTDIKDVM